MSEVLQKIKMQLENIYDALNLDPIVICLVWDRRQISLLINV